MRIQRFVLTALLLFGLAACSSTTSRNKLPALTVQAQVDLKQFMGRWYVIANIPYGAERGKVGTYVEYRQRDDGRLDDLYFFRKKNFEAPIKQWSGVAWVVDKNTNARWLAQFVWPLKFDYLILETAPDYSWAMVGHPGRDLAWVFARTPEMDAALYADIQAKFAEQGYDVTRLMRVPQKPLDLGATGYQ